MNSNYLSQIKKLSDEVQDNYDVIIKKNKIAKKAGTAVDEWPEDIKEFFSEMNGIDIYWQSYEHKNKANISGRINILSSEKVAMDTKGVVWFEHTPENSILRKFRMIDNFVNEAAVGFVENDAAGQLFFYAFEGEPESLDINFDGYIQLLCMCKGFFYWQRSLIEIITKAKRESQETKDLKEYLPKLFPEFNFETFANLFQKVRLHKK